MRIGIGIGSVGGAPVDVRGHVEQAVAAERDGLDCAWFTHILGVDSLIAIALAGARTSRIEFVTGVVPVYSRQPVLMAQQALTAQAATQGRLTLGIGVAHPETVPLLWSQAYERPARYMSEYLSVLLPLLRDKRVRHYGDVFTVEAALQFPGVDAPGVLLAALGPVMLRLAGSRADGTVLWVTGPVAIRNHVAPRINAAAEKAGRDRPRICAALPICVTDEPDRAREAAARMYSRYGRLVNYRRVLDIEGVDGPQDIAVVGDEQAAEEQIRRLAEAGATDFFGMPFALDAADGESVPRARALLRYLVGKI